MAALITDEFRLFNADNFIESVTDPDNSYYIFVGLPNPVGEGYGRSEDWNNDPLAPIDNFSYIRSCYDWMMYGRRITPGNIRRVIRRVDWTKGTRYDQYRDDYSVYNVSPNSGSTRLYDTNYYVLNSDFRVYECLSNGSSGDNPKGNGSEDEPNFVDTEPSAAGSSGDGYIWKYLFTVSPADVIKFDSTEFITVPSDWLTTDSPQIVSIRESGDSTINDAQLKQIYIDKRGSGYSGGAGQELPILGDGTGARAVVDVNSGQITKALVSKGGKGYTWGLVDLGSINTSASEAAKLDVIVPPSIGHGFDIYQELGTDRVLVYARFDDSTQDFPIDTQFAQIGILRNPTINDSITVFTENTFTAADSLKLTPSYNGTLDVGDVIEQSTVDGIARGYVISFNPDTQVIKYTQDRSLYYNPPGKTNTDYVGISTNGNQVSFISNSNNITGPGFSGALDTSFTGSTLTVGNRAVELGVEFTKGVARSEINKPSGEILYLDNRPLVTRNPRQKEDVKIILEF
ncbi:baseplate wedge subunit [Synechococcus phage S-CAM7]|uniref:Baseplate wedge n=1 Tax=Synechococcus phage S-CAM7 TaxID=1883368 RepID=A0A1D8KUK1_9CAUD|nr:baseplate wedge subunit [Synechococcus phage S-CAM7]AOV62053.1 baseplate wedge [Synechococcus phage S-CAM7]AOV62316.1 baseplate wedge [Synechococcus phage S-CAM7]QLF86179.1 baseplate wedge protein [Synechococcus phage S-CAM7]